MGLEHYADVLCVRQVERSVDFVEDVHGRGLEEQQPQDERELPSVAGEMRRSGGKAQPLAQPLFQRRGHSLSDDWHSFVIT